MRYESYSAPEINTVLAWVGDKEIVSLMAAQAPEGNHAPFFVVVVVADPPKNKGGRPRKVQ